MGHLVYLNKNNMTGATSEAGTVYPTGAPEFRFVFTSSCLWEGSCLIYVICVCLRIVVSNTYCVVFFVFLVIVLCALCWHVSLDCPICIAPGMFSNVYSHRFVSNVHVAPSLVFCIAYYSLSTIACLFVIYLVFGNRILFLSSNYGFWLPLWYSKTFLLSKA